MLYRTILKIKLISSSIISSVIIVSLFTYLDKITNGLGIGIIIYKLITIIFISTIISILFTLGVEEKQPIFQDKSKKNKKLNKKHSSFDSLIDD